MFQPWGIPDSGVATADLVAGPSFHPTWFAYTDNVTSSALVYGTEPTDTEMLDGAAGPSRKFTDYFSINGTPTSRSSGFLVSTYDGTNHSCMVQATSKWTNPTVGQVIFYSGLVDVHCPTGSLGAIHPYQLSNSAQTDYLFFTHTLRQDGTTFRWDFEFPRLSYPQDRYYVILNQDTGYFFNIRMTPQSSTIAKVAINIYDSLGNLLKDSSQFIDNNNDPLGSHNLASDNPDMSIPGGAQDYYYGHLQIGNNSDSGATAGNFSLWKHLSVHITTDGNDWPKGRIPS